MGNFQTQVQRLSATGRRAGEPVIAHPLAVERLQFTIRTCANSRLDLLPDVHNRGHAGEVTVLKGHHLPEAPIFRRVSVQPGVSVVAAVQVAIFGVEVSTGTTAPGLDIVVRAANRLVKQAAKPEVMRFTRQDGGHDHPVIGDTCSLAILYRKFGAIKIALVTRRRTSDMGNE
ncbi:hypothetical protein D3C81_1278830 [compost metagenome]